MLDEKFYFTLVYDQDDEADISLVLSLNQVRVLGEKLLIDPSNLPKIRKVVRAKCMVKTRTTMDNLRHVFSCKPYTVEWEWKS